MSNNSIIAGAFEDAMIRIFDRSKLVHSFEAHDESVMSLSFTNNPYELFSCGQDGLVKLWDLRKYSVVCSFKVPQFSCRLIRRNTMRRPIALLLEKAVSLHQAEQTG